MTEHDPTPAVPGIPRWFTRLLIWVMTLGLLAWVLWQAPLGPALAVLRGVNPLALAGLLALNLVVIGSFALRWWLLLDAQGQRVPFGAALVYRLMTFGVSYFTPGPQFGGEPLQVWTVERRHGVPARQALAAVTLDKAIELAANFGFLLFGALLLLVLGTELQQYAPLAIGLGALWMLMPLAYLAALWQGKAPVAGLLRTLARWPQTDGFRQAALEGEETAGRLFRQAPLRVALAMLVSAASWGLMVVEYWWALRVLGGDLPLVETVLALTAGRLAFLLPAPGGLGALEASQVLALTALGGSAALGLSVSLLIRARDVLLGGAGLLLVAVLPWSREHAAQLSQRKQVEG